MEEENLDVHYIVMLIRFRKMHMLCLAVAGVHMR